MDNISDKKMLIWDNGLYISFAAKLGEVFKEVYYFTPWNDAFPSKQRTMFGFGVEGITRVNNFFDYVDEVDIIFFPDVGNGDLQEYLRDKGKFVFGCGYAEDIEQNRWETRELFKKLEIPTTESEQIFGLEKLRERLKKIDDKFIKTSTFRSDFETFKHDNYKLSEPHFDEMEHKLGPIKKVMEFIVEEPIKDAVEGGIDTFSVNGKYPKHCLSGFEIKGCMYGCAFVEYDKLPLSLTEFTDKMEFTFKDISFCGFISTEQRITKSASYPIDQTVRLGNPPNAVQQELISAKSLGEIIYYGARGILVEPEPVAKFGMQVNLESEWYNEGNWQVIHIPKEIRQWVKLANFTVIEEETYIIPKMGVIGSVVAIGDSMDECKKKLEKYVPQIQGYKITACMESIEDFEDVVNEAIEAGIDIFD